VFILIKEHTITAIVAASIAQELDLVAGDILLTINGQPIKDMLDYRWLMDDECLLVEIKKTNGEIWELEIVKTAARIWG